MNLTDLKRRIEQLEKEWDERELYFPDENLETDNLYRITDLKIMEHDDRLFLETETTHETGDEESD